MVRFVVVLCTLFVLASAAPVFADEGVPPPPPPPGAPPVEIPLQPGIVVDDDPQPPASPVIVLEEGPPSLPRGCTIEYRGLPCYQKRDPCGFALDSCGRPYGRFEVMVEGRYGCFPQPDGLLGEPAIGGLAPQFDWEDLECTGAWGGRGALRYEVAPQQWFELKGTYYGSWDDSASRVGVFGFRPGLGGPGDPLTSPAMNGTLRNEAEAYGGELNFQSEIACTGCVRFDLLIGARYFRFEEDSRADFVRPALANVAGPAFVASSATSQFAGLQVGGVAHWDLGRKFEILAGLKVLGGWARREATVSDLSMFSGGFHTASGDEDAMEWGGEIEVGFRWRMLRHVSLTGSYNLFALDGMQRAYDAMDFSQSTSGAVQVALREDEVFFQSFFLGLTVDF